MSSNPSLIVNNFPSVPLGPLVDKNGVMTAPWIQYFTQISMFMQNNLNSEGVKLPQQINHNVTMSGPLNTIKSIGKIIYNSDAHTAMVNINGTYKTIVTM